MNKIISLDLDGTLLRNDKTMSEKTIAILKECESKGHIIIFNTARPPRVVIPVLPEAFKVDYLICYNGAEIYYGKEKIYESCIPVESLKYIIDTVIEKNPNSTISLEIDDVHYANQCIEKIYGKIPYELVDFKKMELKPAAKVLIYLGDLENHQEVIDCIPDNCSIVVTDQGILGQVLLNGASKLGAIKHIVDRLGYIMDDVIAFGDDFNDMDIIVSSGTGVAMGNAVQELKDAADFITETNEEDGVAVFLEKYLLNINKTESN